LSVILLSIHDDDDDGGGKLWELYSLPAGCHLLLRHWRIYLLRAAKHSINFHTQHTGVVF